MEENKTILTDYFNTNDAFFYPYRRGRTVLFSA